MTREYREIKWSDQRRAGSKVTAIEGAGHSVYESHAADVAAVIEKAVRQLGSVVD